MVIAGLPVLVIVAAAVMAAAVVIESEGGIMVPKDAFPSAVFLLTLLYEVCCV